MASVTAMAEAGDKIRINRAPVLTLSAAVVAERLGFDRDTALTLGQAVAGPAFTRSPGRHRAAARIGPRAGRLAGRGRAPACRPARAGGAGGANAGAGCG